MTGSRKFPPTPAPTVVLALAGPSRAAGRRRCHAQNVVDKKTLYRERLQIGPQEESHATFSMMSGATLGVTGTSLRKPPVPVLVALTAKPSTVAGMPGARFVAGFSE